MKGLPITLLRCFVLETTCCCENSAGLTFYTSCFIYFPCSGTFSSLIFFSK